MDNTRFTEAVFTPVNVEDVPEPEPVPLQQYFWEETAPPSRNTTTREHCIAVTIIRKQARGPGQERSRYAAP